MEQNKFLETTVNSIPEKRGSFGFLLVNVSLGFLLPLFSVIAEHFMEQAPLDWSLAGKWLIFWAVGIRLFSAGIRQASNPAFTAHEIFHLKASESLVIVRELGFANISLGVMSILAVINENWRQIAAIPGGLFLGLAAVQHLGRRPANKNELIATVYDVYVFLMLACYLASTLLA